MVMGGELTPISKLSGAFPRAPHPNSPAVRLLRIIACGRIPRPKIRLESLKGILTDLGAGKEINETIEEHTAAMDDLEKEFCGFVAQRAQTLAPGLDWEKPEIAGSDLV